MASSSGASGASAEGFLMSNLGFLLEEGLPSSFSPWWVRANCSPARFGRAAENREDIAGCVIQRVMDRESEVGTWLN